MTIFSSKRVFHKHVSFPLFFVLAILLLTGCGAAAAMPPSTVVPSPTAPPPTSLPSPATTATATATPSAIPTMAMSPAARAYLEYALDTLQQNSIRRETVDWSLLRPEAEARARDAQTPADTYPAIRYAVAELGDNHSKFYDPEQAAALRKLTVADNTPPRLSVGKDRIAYLFMPGFVTFDDAQRHLYADKLQSLIRDADAGRPCGWVLDLRGNTGGNIWPMIAGLGPLLGDGLLGAFEYPSGEKQEWIYRQGEALLGEHVMEQVDGGGYRLSLDNAPVAVLAGPKTKSAGEAVAIAFRGRLNTRSFGEPTGGLTTANATYDLSDGAALVITVVTDADRTGRVYGGPLQPDQTAADAPGAGDAALNAATGWLRGQPDCALK